MNERRDIIRQRLNRVFRDVFDDDSIQIVEGLTAADMDGWDSLAHVTLVVAVEKEFGLRLNAGEVGKLENVGAMLDLLEARATQ